MCREVVAARTLAPLDKPAPCCNCEGEGVRV